MLLAHKSRHLCEPFMRQPGAYKGMEVPQKRVTSALSALPGGIGYPLSLTFTTAYV